MDIMEEVTPAPSIEKELDNIYYNCSECSSLIEIISINEKNNIIKFKCNNKNNNHNKEMIIKEYLKKMKKNKIIHNKEYIKYYFNCNKHLCKLCLKSKEHIKHNKSNIIVEIQPNKEDL